MSFPGGNPNRSRPTVAQWVMVKNTTEETIPARSFARVTGGTRLSSGTEVLNVAKPDGSSDSVYVSTGPVDIPAGGIGGAYWANTPVWVKVATGASIDEMGEIGPSDGEWTAADDGQGFTCFRFDSEKSEALIRGIVSTIPESMNIEVFGDPQGGKLVLTIKVKTGENEDGSPIYSSNADVEINFPTPAAEDVVAAFMATGLFTTDQVFTRHPGWELPRHNVNIAFRKGIKLSDVVIVSIDDTQMSQCVHEPYAHIIFLGVK